MDTPSGDRGLGSSGGRGVAINSTRAGYLPVPLAHVPAEALRGIPVFLRAGADAGEGGATGVFVRYRGVEQPLSATDREELLRSGVQVVYIPMADQARFREQTEAEIVRLASDPKLAISTRAAIVYETGIELVNELLGDPDLARFSGRLESISRAITTMVLNDPSAFPHLLTASHHDYYTATHMVNVATYIAPLAYALGYRKADDLNDICQAGLLHDIGKLYVPEVVLNKQGPLSEEDWWLLRRHAELGAVHLQSYADIHPLVPMVARQHHERLDGSGYPGRLMGNRIHPVSRICAVVDSYDAMTAFRPFKQRTLTVSEALETLRSEAGSKYDAEVVRTWIRLVDSAMEVEPAEHPCCGADGGAQVERRGYQRFAFNCPARVHCLELGRGAAREGPALQMVAHSISRSGLGLLGQVPIPVGQPVRVYLVARVWTNEYVEGQAVRCQGYQDGWYEIGVRFTGRGRVGQVDADRHQPVGTS